MKKINTKARVEVQQVNGVNINVWTKVCPVCSKEYKTSVRAQKYCSDKCCKKATKRKQKQQKEYSAIKEVARLSARAHSLAVETMNQLEKLVLVKKECSCGCTEGLQVHHKDLNWLNNTPSNLVWLCPKCHSEEHSKILKDLKDKGKDLYDLYESSFHPIIAQLNKDLQ